MQFILFFHDRYKIDTSELGAPVSSMIWKKKKNNEKTGGQVRLCY